MRRCAASVPEVQREAIHALVDALQRLPQSTPDLNLEVTISHPDSVRDTGNWAWADIRLSANAFVLGKGAHYYDSAVGGDTESGILFATFLGEPYVEGDHIDIERWLELARYLATDGDVSVEAWEE